MPKLLISIDGSIQTSRGETYVDLYINGSKHYWTRSYIRLGNVIISPFIWRWDISKTNRQIKVGPVWVYL